MEIELILCDCGNVEHQLVILKDADEIWFSIHLSKLPFWQRVRYAFAYIFGRQSKYGAFAEILVSDMQRKHIIDFLKK